nr:MAG TPA: hypothetical protein [Caudoviricetes sp.]
MGLYLITLLIRYTLEASTNGRYINYLVRELVRNDGI